MVDTHSLIQKPLETVAMTKLRSLLVLLAVVPVALVAATVTVPNTFANGTVANATAVNQNFSTLADAVGTRTTIPYATKQMNQTNGLTTTGFQNMELGRTYRLTASFNRGSGGGTRPLQLICNYSGTAMTVYENSSAGFSATSVRVFVATTPSVSCSVTSIFDATVELTLEQLPGHEPTTRWD